jgi:spore coat protein CotF
MQLTQKETGLLKDLKEQEQLLTEKYAKESKKATDPQLQNLFMQISKEEQHHGELLKDIENGTAPTAIDSGSQGKPTFTATYGMSQNQNKEEDSFLCTDALSGEKYLSHSYDVCVFEFKEENVRKVLNQIQAEEQEHGKMIYDYMNKNGMYS